MPGWQISKATMSWPGAALESRIACRRVPGPESATFTTVNVERTCRPSKRSRASRSLLTFLGASALDRRPYKSLVKQFIATLLSVVCGNELCRRERADRALERQHGAGGGALAVLLLLDISGFVKKE